MEKKTWLAIYTQPRWEKKVHRLLQDQQLTSYCPLNTVYRKWSDRMKKVEEPLFKSYVFVQVTAKEQTLVRMTPGVLNFVYWLGKPAVIKPEEIETIRRFMNEYEEVEVVNLSDIKPGDQLVVRSGLLMGENGVALRVGKKLVEVRIESIGMGLVAKIDKQKLEKKA